jgi:hypothetical protein
MTRWLMDIAGKEIAVEGRLIRIARLAAEKYEFLDDPPAMIDALRECRARVDLFTFMQRLSDRTPRYPYPLEWDNLAAVPVSAFDHWWTKQINGKTRNMIRRAEKAGVVVREVPFDDPLVEGISAIYNECPTRQAKPFWHYGKELAAVRRENGTFLDRSVFLAAYWQTTLIGFAKLVIDEHGSQAGLMQIISMIRHRDKAPTNALIAQAIRSCAERGIQHLVYSNFAARTNQRDTLTEFKEHNGFQRIELPRYYVPLTTLGRAAFAASLHHKATDHLPEAMIAGLRRVRRAWHRAAISTARERS